MKTKALRWILCCCTLAVAIMIFFFSAQDGDASSNTSGFVVQLLKDALSSVIGLFLGHTPDQHELTFFVRKLGHFSEFALLCFFLRLSLQSFSARYASLIAWGVSTLYAMTDEFHQLFSDGRAAQFQDVMIDSSGALFGLLAAILLLRIRRFIITRR